MHLIFEHLKWSLVLPALILAACATNPYPAYYGYGPPPGSVTPTIPYTYTPNYGYGYYQEPYAYPAYYYGIGVWPGYGQAWYPGYGGYGYYYPQRPRAIISVTPTVPSAPRSGPPPAVNPVLPRPPTVHPVEPLRQIPRPCVTRRTRAGVTTVCP